MIIVLVGKSASGKDTVLADLVKANIAKRYITCTTRPMRWGEIQGISYNFLTDAEFKEKLSNNELLEYRSYNTFVHETPATWYYGTPKLSETELNTRNFVIILDLKGAAKFTEAYGRDNCLVVGLTCPDKERRLRALRRGSFDESEWKRRCEADEIDFQDLSKYADVIYDSSILTPTKITNEIFKKLDKMQYKTEIEDRTDER